MVQLNRFILSIVQQSLILSIGVMGIYITYRILKFADLAADGSFTLGASIAAVSLVKGLNPFFALVLAFLGGGAVGLTTGILNVKFKIQDILASILVMVGLHSINLRVMGGQANIPLFDRETIFKEEGQIFIILGLTVFVALLFTFFFKTKFGYLLKGIGSNESMVKSLGIDTSKVKLVALALSNGLIALSGSIMAQYQSFSDINMGRETMIMGLAAIIIGFNIFRTRENSNLALRCIVGTFIYRLSIAMSLKLGFKASDLRLISSLIVILALTLGNEEVFKIRRIRIPGVKKGNRLKKLGDSNA